MKSILYANIICPDALFYLTGGDLSSLKTLTKAVSILLVKGQGFVDACGNLYPKLMGALMNTSVGHCNYSVSVIKVVRYPRSKGWFIF